MKNLDAATKIQFPISLTGFCALGIVRKEFLVPRLAYKLKVMADIGLVLRKQQSKLGEALTKKTHFSVNEIENLLNLYRKLSVGIEVDRLDRTRFREFLHNAFDMTDDILLDRIFKFFDDDNDGFISREEWILALSVFMRGKYIQTSIFHRPSY